MEPVKWTLEKTASQQSRSKGMKMGIHFFADHKSYFRNVSETKEEQEVWEPDGSNGTFTFLTFGLAAGQKVSPD